MKKRNLILGGLLAGTLALGSAGIAHAGKSGYCKYGKHGKHHRMFRHLGLSDTQRDQVFKIMHASKPAKYEKMKQLRALREDMRKLIHSDSFDSGAYRKLAQKKAAILTDLMVLKAETRNKIYQVFTPEQKKKVQEYGKRRGRYGHGHGHGHRHRYGSPESS